VVCSTNFLKGSAAASYKTSLHSAKKASTMQEHLGSSKISEPTGESDLRLPLLKYGLCEPAELQLADLTGACPGAFQRSHIPSHVLTDPSQARPGLTTAVEPVKW
jgi:hypothetical protein